MSIQNRPYSDPTFNASHSLGLGRITPTASGAAAEVVGQHRFFTAVKVLEVRAIVKVAGKGNTSGFDILKGTSSIGQCLFGTQAAASVVDASLTDTDFETTDDFYLKNIVATDTGSCFLSINYQERFTA
jgi:hypothetical protein